MKAREADIGLKRMISVDVYEVQEWLIPITAGSDPQSVLIKEINTRY